MNDDLNTLEGTRLAVWAALEAGVTTPSAPARTVALATQAQSGGGAVRMVVLRAVDRNSEELTFYTHGASAKVSEVLSQPAAEVLVWDPDRQFQIRLSGKIEVSPGPFEIWETFGPGTRKNYAEAPRPGSNMITPDEVEPKPDPNAFTVLTFRIETIETLWLAKEVSHRARFTKRGASWIAP